MGTTQEVSPICPSFSKGDLQWRGGRCLFPVRFHQTGSKEHTEQQVFFLWKCVWKVGSSAETCWGRLLIFREKGRAVMALGSEESAAIHEHGS